MTQHFTSANTSINKTKLPAIYKKINFDVYTPTEVIDYGCGKFNNTKDYINSLGVCWLGYDPYNRSEEENRNTLCFLNRRDAHCMVCSNVLNVIEEDSIIQEIADYITLNSVHYFVTVYEGDKSGIGKQTKDDCYQRNEKITAYIRFFPRATVKNGVITNAPWAVK